MLKNIREKLYPLKQNLVSLFRYPKLQWRNSDYNAYWHHRKLTAQTPLNSFQKKRADLALRYLKSDSSFIDVGSGNGRVLLYMNERKKIKEMIGVDVSDDALAMARDNGIRVFSSDISRLDELEKIPRADYVSMFEILEHVPNSEEVLGWAIKNSKEGVFFSVPNTGFLFHRLRLLFGRFPLQWRLRPSEHVRFWTVRDMRWWLREMNIENYSLHLYEGARLLNVIWPGLFGRGMFIYIPTKNTHG